MKIKGIEVKNFKSIKKVYLPIQSYGEGNSKSNATILVGINESGKSALLDAISFLNVGMEKVEYDTNCYKDSQENNEYIYLTASLDIDWTNNQAHYKNILSKSSSVCDEFIQLLSLSNFARKNTWKKNEKCGSYFILSIDSDIPYYKFVVTKKTSTGTSTITAIENLSNYVESGTEINAENAKTFIGDGQELLTKSKAEEIVRNKLTAELNRQIPTIQIWKPKPEYLINDSVDLEEFKEDTSLSIPLKNMFHIYGKKTDADIKDTIDKALSNQAKCDELKDRMSAKITKYINDIWKEHKIQIHISINGSLCEVYVADKDKKYAYYDMNQRSDGFKQFISLILSLSVQNKTKSLTNNIILIDEPEVHLHPSGVKYLRDEILEIGKNNMVVVSTHSHYMIDTDVPERHWVVKKDKAETSISQLSETANITDDKVVSEAFGLNVFKELLPQNIIIVEGEDDKAIINQALFYLKDTFKFAIKPAGGASKAPGYARLLSEESLQPFVLLDADKEGLDNKKKIIQEQKPHYSDNNVCTLVDILPALPKDSTIEDLIPIDFVKTFFDREMGMTFTLVNTASVISQLKNQSPQLKENKQKLDSLKIKLSKEFCDHYNTKASLLAIPLLNEFSDNLVLKFETLG